MESILIVITLVSLTMTIALGAILARLIRDERRRSDARVAVLREVADAAARQQEAVEPVAVSNVRNVGDVESVSRVARRVEHVAHWEASGVTADDLSLTRTDDAHTASADLFVRPESRSAWPRRLAVAATIAVLVGVTGLALRSRSTSADSASGLTGSVRTGAASIQTAGLLELLSLKQTQESGALTITGLVQNPREGAVLSKVMATAFLFGPDGTFLASGRAPLDFTVLRPGDESGFVINVPVTAPVARYRVGFRSADGRVIGHIDRRTAAAMAGGRHSVPERPRGAS
jgi:type II secretory pathway pseudopilin PulG